jgi:hypothetical protein
MRLDGDNPPASGSGVNIIFLFFFKINDGPRQAPILAGKNETTSIYSCHLNKTSLEMVFAIFFQ